MKKSRGHRKSKPADRTERLPSHAVMNSCSHGARSSPL